MEAEMHHQEMRAAFEELQDFIQAQLRQQNAILIREFARGVGGGPLKPKGYGRAMAKPRFQVSEVQPSLVEFNPDEGLEDEAATKFARKDSTESDAPRKVVALKTSSSSSFVESDRMDDEDDKVQRPSVDSARFTFVRKNIAKKQEHAQGTAEKRLPQSVHTPASIPKRSVHIDQTNWAYKVVSSRQFMYLTTMVIVVNLILLGVEVEMSAQDPDTEHSFFFWANLLIVGIYTLETFLKFVAYGILGFFLGPDRLWNVFDFLIIGVSMTEAAGEVIYTASSANMDSSFFRVVRFIRLLRALRGIRVIRIIHYVGSLRFAIASTAGSLFWTLVLLVLVFYIFGVILAQLVSDHCKALVANNGTCRADGLQYWAGLGESMLTLFMVVSGGVSWDDTMRPLRAISPLAVVCMVVYIVISIFTILNVVTGVFCNTAIESAHADRDIAIMKQLAKQKAQVLALQEIFFEIDSEQNESVSILDLKSAMETEKLATFMESLDISTEDVWTLFMIIDADGSGEITLDEFVSGCMQLHGPAKSLQLAKMSYENKVTRREIRRLHAQVDTILKFFDLEPPISGSRQSL